MKIIVDAEDVLGGLSQYKDVLDMRHANISQLVEDVNDEYAVGAVGSVNKVIDDLFDSVGYAEYGICEIASLHMDIKRWEDPIARSVSETGMLPGE